MNTPTTPTTTIATAEIKHTRTKWILCKISTWLQLPPTARFSEQFSSLTFCLFSSLLLPILCVIIQHNQEQIVCESKESELGKMKKYTYSESYWKKNDWTASLCSDHWEKKRINAKNIYTHDRFSFWRLRSSNLQICSEIIDKVLCIKNIHKTCIQTKQWLLSVIAANVWK